MSNLGSNLLALFLVVGICWIGMVVLSAFFHRARQEEPDNLFEQAARRGPMVDDPRGDGVPVVGSGVKPRPAVSVPRNQPCETCSGVGASSERGRLHPCPECEGTGIR